MAKLDKNLFDEIVEEMMKDKKTILEMMAELDVDEQNIFDSQERLARKKQLQMFDGDKKKGPEKAAASGASAGGAENRKDAKKAKK